MIKLLELGIFFYAERHFLVFFYWKCFDLSILCVYTNSRPVLWVSGVYISQNWISTARALINRKFGMHGKPTFFFDSQLFV